MQLLMPRQMKTKFKALGWKGKLFAIWASLELVCLPLALPAMAGLQERVKFTIPQAAFAEILPSEAGTQRFLVASNAPFAIISEGVVAEMDVNITQSGIHNGQAFGGKAQMPGALSHCAMPSSQYSSRIYTGYQKTAASRGDVYEQAVLIEITYDASLAPKLDVVTIDAATKMNALLAFPCTDTTA